MGRVIAFYILGVLWVVSFGAAAATAGAPVAVVCGTLSLLGFLGATVARIGAQQPPAGRGSGTVRGGG